MSEASETNKALVLEYMERRFRQFNPARYVANLADNPTYMAGMNIRTGREASAQTPRRAACRTRGRRKRRPSTSRCSPTATGSRSC